MSAHNKYDCIIIIRGGGSKLDLAWFDNYNIGVAIGKSRIPVITGIGHDIDSTVADIVAHTSLKTPTAVAGFLIDHNASFEAEISIMMERIGHLARKVVKQYEYNMTALTRMLASIPQEKVNNRHLQLQFKTQQIRSVVLHKLWQQKEKLESITGRISILQPRNVLKRGFAIIHQDGAIIGRASGFNVHKQTEIEFFDNSIKIAPDEK
jgi:exodeoxyribonuclease VII large subunit